MDTLQSFILIPDANTKVQPIKVITWWTEALLQFKPFLISFVDKINRKSLDSWSSVW